MKRFLLVCGLLVLAACTKDLTEAPAHSDEQGGAVIIGEPTLAIKGCVNVKLTPEAAAKVDVLLQSAGTQMQTRSGIADIDEVLAQIGTTSIERMVAYDPNWEDAYAQTGMNLWYVIHFSDEAAMDVVAKTLAAQPEISVFEYQLHPKYQRGQHVGPAKPFTAENERVKLATRAPIVMNDPMLTYQWNFDNSFNEADYSGFITPPQAGADINLIDAWNLCTGDPNIIVAVIDQAVYTEHPDLKANIWSNPSKPDEHGKNFLNSSSALDWKSVGQETIGGQTYYEYTDHGSHVAGVIAAVNNNVRGVSSIAGGKNNGGGVKIMSCQTLGYGKSYSPQAGNAAVNALEYAWKNGAIIAQNSWGFNYGSATGLTPSGVASDWESGTKYGSLKTAIRTFVSSAGKNNPNSPLKGGLVIFAAGNDGDIYADAKMYPAADEPVIAVGSMGWDYRPAYYTDYGSWVDITAPGGDAYAGRHTDGYIYNDSQVLSTILCDDSIDYKDGRKKNGNMYGYGFMQGTSMACPHVSGVAALALSYAAQCGKSYTPAQFRALLLSSVYGIDQYFTGSINAGSKTLNAENYRNKMGGGCIDALKLLLAIKGTPAIYVKTDEAVSIDFSRFFGGSNSKVKMLSASSSEAGNLGFASFPAFQDGKLNITCTKVGAAMVTVKAQAGDTQITREFAIVSRPGLADNGGWL